jgi:hypothetical protein
MNLHVYLLGYEHEDILCLTKDHTMKKYGGVEVYILTFLN